MDSLLAGSQSQDGTTAWVPCIILEQKRESPVFRSPEVSVSEQRLNIGTCLLSFILTFVQKHHYLLEDFHEGHVVVAIFLQKI